MSKTFYYFAVAMVIGIVAVIIVASKAMEDIPEMLPYPTPNFTVKEPYQSPSNPCDTMDCVTGDLK